MRTVRAALAVVLGGIVAGAGCCKTCDWCGGKGSTQADLPPSAKPVATPTERTAPLTGSTRPPQTATPTGAYGGTGDAAAPR